jgi:hypothetical protein
MIKNADDIKNDFHECTLQVVMLLKRSPARCQLLSQTVILRF